MVSLQILEGSLFSHNFFPLQPLIIISAVLLLSGFNASMSFPKMWYSQLNEIFQMWLLTNKKQLVLNPDIVLYKVFAVRLALYVLSTYLIQIIYKYTKSYKA